MGYLVGLPSFPDSSLTNNSAARSDVNLLDLFQGSSQFRYIVEGPVLGWFSLYDLVKSVECKNGNLLISKQGDCGSELIGFSLVKGM
jgi:hypothetical protein